MVYEGRFASFWGRGDRAVIVNSFSKTLAMTGWRIGFLVAPRALAVQINKIHYHMMACPSTPAQVAVLAGLNESGEAVRAMVAEFRARRDLVVKGLNRIPGLKCVPRPARSTRSPGLPGPARRRDRDDAPFPRAHHDARRRLRFSRGVAPASFVRHVAREPEEGARDPPALRGRGLGRMMLRWLGRVLAASRAFVPETRKGPLAQIGREIEELDRPVTPSVRGRAPDGARRISAR